MEWAQVLVIVFGNLAIILQRRDAFDRPRD